MTEKKEDKYNRYNLALLKTGMDADTDKYLQDTLRQRGLSFANYCRELIQKDKNNELNKLLLSNIVIDKSITEKIDVITADIKYMLSNNNNGNVIGMVLEKLILLENTIKNINFNTTECVRTHPVAQTTPSINNNIILDKIDILEDLIHNIEIPTTNNTELINKLDMQNQQINALTGAVNQLAGLVTQQQQMIQLILANQSSAMQVVPNLTHDLSRLSVVAESGVTDEVDKEELQRQRELEEKKKIARKAKPGLGGLGKK